MTKPLKIFNKKSKSLYMTTEEKNKWIEREKQFLEKHKEVYKDECSYIFSQMTFCSDE